MSLRPRRAAILDRRVVGWRAIACAAAAFFSFAGNAAAAGDAAGWLEAAETAMTRGDTPAAIALLDRAAAMSHAADTEMALVRAYVQQGDYRRALAFAAHVAGAHRDAPAATALYAWLLSVGGQGPFAQRLLKEAWLRAPHDAVLSEAQSRLQTAGATATPALLDRPHRMAPHGVMLPGQPPLPPTARTVASGVLLQDGRHALVPSGAVAGESSPLWLRDGLGRTTAARVERRLEAVGLALVTLDAPLDGSATLPVQRDPFAGSPGFVVAFTPADDAAPAWPWLYQGFLGGLGAAPSTGRRLGIDVPPPVHGAPVFDAAGGWCGIAMKRNDGGHELLGMQRLRDEVGAALLPPPQAPPGGPDGGGWRKRALPDEIFEASLRVALQVVTAPVSPSP